MRKRLQIRKFITKILLTFITLFDVMTEKQMYDRGREIYIRNHGHDIESERLDSQPHYVGTLFDCWLWDF